MNLWAFKYFFIFLMIFFVFSAAEEEENEEVVDKNLVQGIGTYGMIHCTPRTCCRITQRCCMNNLKCCKRYFSTRRETSTIPC